MKNDTTSIKNILCIPYTPSLWLYYINDGERHAVLEEQLSKMLSNLVPELAYNVIEKMSRHLPFFIEIDKKEFHDIEVNFEDERNQVRKKKLSFNLQEVTSNIIGQKEKETIIDRIMNKIKKGV